VGLIESVILGVFTHNNKFTQTSSQNQTKKFNLPSIFIIL